MILSVLGETGALFLLGRSSPKSMMYAKRHKETWVYVKRHRKTSLIDFVLCLPRLIQVL